MNRQPRFSFGWRRQEGQDLITFTDPAPAPKILQDRIIRLTPLVRPAIDGCVERSILCPIDPQEVERAVLPDWATPLPSGTRGELYELMRLGSVTFRLATTYLHAMTVPIMEAALDYARQCRLTLSHIETHEIHMRMDTYRLSKLEMDGQVPMCALPIFAHTDQCKRDGWMIIVAGYPDELPFASWVLRHVQSLVAESVAMATVSLHHPPGTQPAN